LTKHIVNKHLLNVKKGLKLIVRPNRLSESAEDAPSPLKNAYLISAESKGPNIGSNLFIFNA